MRMGFIEPATCYAFGERQHPPASASDDFLPAVLPSPQSPSLRRSPPSLTPRSSCPIWRRSPADRAAGTACLEKTGPSV